MRTTFFWLAQRLQLIVLLLFLLYALCAVGVLAIIPDADSPGAAMGCIILLLGPTPLLAAEFLAVFLRWPPAVYLCTVLWLLASIYAWLSLLVTLSGYTNSPLASTVFSVVMVVAGSVSALLAFLHTLWLKLSPPISAGRTSTLSDGRASRRDA